MLIVLYATIVLILPLFFLSLKVAKEDFCFLKSTFMEVCYISTATVCLSGIGASLAWLYGLSPVVTAIIACFAGCVGLVASLLYWITSREDMFLRMFIRAYKAANDIY